jgi:hypothetical protein
MLISDEYLAEQKALHAKGGYGTASLQFGEVVTQICDKLGIKTLLDYGCGSMQNLSKVLHPANDVEYLGYDPAVPEFSYKEPADLVTCIDVLEHIEPDLLDNVLDDLMMLTDGYAFITVHTGPAVKTLSDGRNAHLIQKPARWWLPKLMNRFDLVTFQSTKSGFNVLMRASNGT